MKTIRHILFPAIILSGIILSNNVKAATITAAATGNWATAATWSPAVVPVAGDSVVIPSGKTVTVAANAAVAAINILTGGSLVVSSAKTLTMTQSLTVAGTMNMAGIIFFASGKAFTISAGGSFTWNPTTNTSGAATLFTNGIESFATTSTLIINKWYDQISTPLGSVVTGNFGNLTFTMSNITEWNQSNNFQTHLIVGTLTITFGWITFDKSSSISTTNVGNITMTGMSSYLSFHNGTHSGSFTINTTNLSVTDGTLQGLYNGNGNITMNVTGNVTIAGAGYIFLIYNSGVAGVGNGNAVMTVSGNFSQSGTNSRFNEIYNMTTYTAGVSSLTVNGNLTYTGGIFFVHYACHTGTGTVSFTVNGNTSITYGASSDRFWIVGLTILSSTNNTAKLNYKNTGTLTFAGNNSASFTSNAGSGIETDTIVGTVTNSGGNNGFNWPCCTASSHQTTVVMGSNVSVSGGILSLSYFSGTLASSIAGNLSITGGTFDVKYESGAATLDIAGTYTQSAGNFLFHSNASTYTSNVVAVTVASDFTHSGGTINFDNNTNASSATHTLTLNGANYSLTGAGTITHASAGTGTVFGMMYFNKSGTVTFTRSSTSHSIQQVKQTVNSGCTLDVVSGNIQVASNSTAALDFLKISTGANLFIHTGQVVSNALSANSGMRLESGAVLQTQNTYGLYDGTANACISSTGTMNYYLDANSTVEYNGVDNQVVTGIGSGIALGTQHKYGNLKINFVGTTDVEYAYQNTNPVYVRTMLDLASGEYKLNGVTLTVESGASSAITRTSGYVKSEQNAATNNSILTWKTITAGSHIFPFGKNSTSYIPVTLNVTGGIGNDVSVSTRATSAGDNSPWATGVSQMAGSSGSNLAVTNVIDRWWKITATALTADATLTYAGDENTVSAGLQTGTFGLQTWTTFWAPTVGTGTGVTTGTGSVTGTGITTWGNTIITTSSAPLPIKLIFFKAKLNSSSVDLTWGTAAEINNNFFTVERSDDGQNFQPILTKPGAGNSTNNLYYNATDDNPLSGYSYYRLKQTDYDGKFTYSDVQTVKDKNSTDDDGELKIESIGPNPFTESFKVNFMLKEAAIVNIMVMNSSGQVVSEEPFQSTDGYNTYQFIDQHALPKGVYFVYLVYNDQKVSQKIIKN